MSARSSSRSATTARSTTTPRASQALREQVREAGPRAALIYASDKLANSRDLREAYAEIGEQVAERLEITLDLRIEIWRDDEAMCRELLGEPSSSRALAAELDAFDARPRRRLQPLRPATPFI